MRVRTGEGRTSPLYLFKGSNISGRGLPKLLLPYLDVERGCRWKYGWPFQRQWLQKLWNAISTVTSQCWWNEFFCVLCFGSWRQLDLGVPCVPLVEPICCLAVSFVVSLRQLFLITAPSCIIQTLMPSNRVRYLSTLVECVLHIYLVLCSGIPTVAAVGRLCATNLFIWYDTYIYMFSNTV